ncbi:MAG: hypothetical protein LQ351_005349 [Letrouitia transgressa]|nr:MAG: hypothetical protein LQ351_005349 [Letrouitia transgressa]
MPSIKMTAMAATIIFFSSTNAHMKLSQPKPYGASTLNNSPLAADGSDFPCKQRSGVYDAEGANNIMPVGSTQKLAFLGGATHGGGSCQVALTKDLEPTKDSKWMVIHSIVGGCPSAAAGNLNDNAASTGASEFPYKIPDGFSPGKYTLAWTWFNKIGNREMYMNCAPVTVTGGSKRRDLRNETERIATDETFFKRDNKFPDLFKANIGNGCTTTESDDLQFPDPGDSVSKAGTGNSAPPAGSCAGGSGSGAAGSSSGGASTGAGSATGAGAGAGAEAGAGAGAGAGSSASSGAGSASGSGSGSPSAAAPSPAATSVIAIPPEGAPASSAPSAAAPVASQAAPASTGTASSSSGSGNASGSTGSTGSTASTTCSSPGSEVCSPDGTQIGQCDQTGHVVFMAVAPGTKCQGGQMVHAKRSARFAHGYVRRAQALGRW